MDKLFPPLILNYEALSNYVRFTFLAKVAISWEVSY